MRETGFLDRVIDLDGVHYRCQIYVPSNFTPERLWPVVLFLHGVGEGGDDGLRPTEVGLASAIRRNARRFPLVAVFPQAPAGQGWHGQAAEAAVRALDRAVDEFNGDRRRLYVTGLSMGGSGALRIAAEYPDRFAAIAPVCAGFADHGSEPQEISDAGPETGRGGPGLGAAVEEAVTKIAESVGKTPVWLFQGAVDTDPTAREARFIADTLAGHGAKVRYTEYPGVGHNAWDPAYAEPGLVPWLLAQCRR